MIMKAITSLLFQLFSITPCLTASWQWPPSLLSACHSTINGSQSCHRSQHVNMMLDSTSACSCISNCFIALVWSTHVATYASNPTLDSMPAHLSDLLGSTEGRRVRRLHRQHMHRQVTICVGLRLAALCAWPSSQAHRSATYGSAGARQQTSSPAIPGIWVIAPPAAFADIVECNPTGLQLTFLGTAANEACHGCGIRDQDNGCFPNSQSLPFREDYLALHGDTSAMSHTSPGSARGQSAGAGGSAWPCARHGRACCLTAARTRSGRCCRLRMCARPASPAFSSPALMATRSAVCRVSCTPLQL